MTGLGKNNGRGQPYSFRCSACRRIMGGPKPHLDDSLGRAGDVELTGRKRRRTGWAPPCRSDSHARQYRCKTCGHIGWSLHVDLKYKEENTRKKMQLTVEIDVEPGSEHCGECHCRRSDHEGDTFCGAFNASLDGWPGPDKRLKKCREQAKEQG